jgi:hemerythrin-like domain-containing protein
MLDLFEMAPTFNDPLGMLRACHRRIERALTVMERLAAQEQAQRLDEPARETLRQTLRYFATGVPRHAADEEESLFPRLRAVLPEEHAEAVQVIESLQQEHAEADAAHRELDDLGETLLRLGRFEYPEQRARFSELIALLQRLYQEHIRVEDDELLPLAARVVDTTDQDAIGTEMASRRGIDWQQQREVIAQLEARPWSRRSPKRKI